MNYKTDNNLYFIKEELGRQIQKLHEKKQYFNLNDLLNFARNECDFTNGRSKLHKIIKSMGYRYKKISNRKVLIEQPHIVSKRITFLKTYLQYLESGEYTFVFLDETWIYENGTQVYQWVNENERFGIPQRAEGEGKRFTILHAGTSSGFLPNCDLLLSDNTEHRDYHKNMTSIIFMEWVKNQLLPALNNLGAKCAVVMDNAPYHSKQIEKAPSFCTKKNDMKKWLTEHNIQFEPTLNKKSLWEIIRYYKPQIEKSFEIDKLIRDHGHTVLRLPPYNCQYNPIELCWAFLKTYYNKHVQSSSEKKICRVKETWQKALGHYTPEMWANSVRHCEELIKKDWTTLMGNSLITDLPPVIIQLAEDSDSSSNSDF